MKLHHYWIQFYPMSHRTLSHLLVIGAHYGQAVTVLKTHCTNIKYIFSDYKLLWNLVKGQNPPGLNPLGTKPPWQNPPWTKPPMDKTPHGQIPHGQNLPRKKALGQNLPRKYTLGQKMGQSCCHTYCENMVMNQSSIVFHFFCSKFT